MRELVLKVFDEYSLLIAKEAMFERHLDARENPDMRDALALTKIQIGTVESWFALLSLNERVVIRQVLLEDSPSEQANRIAATRWFQGFPAAGQLPLDVKEAALKKIISFADTHRPLMLALFENF